ncbi:MAG: hypothetical protein HY718_06860 [Planctomycetes bacterium]|nr:hypothetical protein [Planctomycetota bacterium]
MSRMSAPVRILITAGPTHEPIDDVRYVANRSSGRMGVALAEAAHAAGCEVTLLLGPVAAGSDRLEAGPTPDRTPRVERFESTADLQQLLVCHFPACDVLIMAAAVADYRPATAARGKLPRRADRLVLELEPTPDLVAACAARRRPGQRIVAFALEEPAKLTERAIEKMRTKGVDAIVANPLETMGSTSVVGVVYTADGRQFAPQAGAMDKPAFARWLIDWVLTHLGAQPS